MDVFTMVAIIVTVACVSSVAGQYLKKQAKDRNARVDEGVQETLDDLRARVEVLEKIVTDEKHRLSREIDGLNDRERYASGQGGR